MSVRIRLKRLGRKNRPFYRLCAMDKRTNRDGRIIEELGTYDPMVSDVDARAILNGERIAYWLGVGAQPSGNARVLIKKYGADGTHLERQKAALERKAQPKAIPDPGQATFVMRAKSKNPAVAPAAAEPAAEAAPAPESAQAPEPVSAPESSAESSS